MSPRLRIDAFSAVPYFCPWKCQEQINMETKEIALLFGFGATRNSLNTSVLTISRVAVCSTLKTIKSLILNALRGAPSVSS